MCVPHKAQDGQDEAQEGQEAKSCVYIYICRGAAFGVAPPIYTHVCIYPLGNDRSLGTFPVAAQLGQEEAQDGNDRSLGTFPVAAVPHKAQDGQDEAQEGQEEAQEGQEEAREGQEEAQDGQDEAQDGQESLLSESLNF